jgi:ABC-type Fe3+ transport system substrate-binding protein
MHPHAALLLYDFMLGEAQEVLARRDLLPTNPNVRPLPGGSSSTHESGADAR